MPMTSMTTVSMHEEVHERAKEERHIEEYTQDVSAMFGKQQHSGNHEEADENHSRRRGGKAALIATTVLVQRHWYPSALIAVVRL